MHGKEAQGFFRFGDDLSAQPPCWVGHLPRLVGGSYSIVPPRASAATKFIWPWHL
jgi:hypothetical protein